jgi:hypothetical protein
VKSDFFMGGRFSSFSDLNSQLQGWLSRVNSAVHGTTYEIPRDRFDEESVHLQHIDQVLPYHNVREETRKVSRDAYVSYLGDHVLDVAPRQGDAGAWEEGEGDSRDQFQIE